MSEWIPCSERMPEKDGFYLTTIRYMFKPKTSAVEVCHLIGKDWSSYADEFMIHGPCYDVIAWMPLPKPYRGQKNG